MKQGEGLPSFTPIPMVIFIPLQPICSQCSKNHLKNSRTLCCPSSLGLRGLKHQKYGKNMKKCWGVAALLRGAAIDLMGCQQRSRLFLQIGLAHAEHVAIAGGDCQRMKPLQTNLLEGRILG